MIRCVRLWTGDDQNSHFEEGRIDLGGKLRGIGGITADLGSR
jgi:hypothetical protein